MNHGLSADQLKNYFTSREHGDYNGLIHFLGKLRGAVRVSIGFPTIIADIEKFMRFAKNLLNKIVPENDLISMFASNEVSGFNSIKTAM